MFETWFSGFLVFGCILKGTVRESLAAVECRKSPFVWHSPRPQEKAKNRGRTEIDHRNGDAKTMHGVAEHVLQTIPVAFLEPREISTCILFNTE